MVAQLLRPLGACYAAGARLRARRARHAKRVAVPVVCVGNAVVGGAGKTPVVIALAQLLKAQGLAVHILARGYGAQDAHASVVRVHLGKHHAQDVGDEPLLLAQVAPCWVGANRVQSARLAVAAGAQVLLMDDGWQYPHLHKDIGVLVVDSAYGVGNGWCLPAGPLREPWADALARADAVVMLGNTPNSLTEQRPSSVPQFSASITPDMEQRVAWQGMRVLAFAGIGRPQKFFDSLQQLGAELVGTRSFADHYAYSLRDLELLLADAKLQHAELVTTTKDWVRLPSELRGRVLTLPVHCAWENAAQVHGWLSQRLQHLHT